MIYIKGGMKLFEIRYLLDSEKDFFKEMLYESIHIKNNKKPPLDDLLSSNELMRYHQNWGREGDKAIVAVDNTENPVGAVWYRLFSSEEQGYGYVNGDIPEVGIAMKEEVRGKGLGTQLMQAIIEEAKIDDFKALSLSVDLDNTNAISLYHRFGFVEVAREGTSITMLLK